jgi:glutamyl-tRNA synthetase
MRELASKLGFAAEMKEYKANPGAYHGGIADVSMVIRLAMTKRTTTPDLYEIMKVIGSNRVQARLKGASQYIKEELSASA